MSDSSDKNEPILEAEDRKKISIIDTEPKDLKEALKVLTPQQQALREAAIRKFKVNKVKGFIAQQVKNLNPNRQIGDSIRFLFDKYGNPPENLPLEDIITERKNIEAQIRWLEAICFELRNNLSKIKEIEDHALDLLEHGAGKE